MDDVSKVCRCQALFGGCSRTEKERKRPQKEWDAEARAMAESAKALISWCHECSPRIYSWFARSSRGNCGPIISYFPFFSAFSSLSFIRLGIMRFLLARKHNKKISCFIIPVRPSYESINKKKSVYDLNE